MHHQTGIDTQTHTQPDKRTLLGWHTQMSTYNNQIGTDSQTGTYMEPDKHCQMGTHYQTDIQHPMGTLG